MSFFRAGKIKAKTVEWSRCAPVVVAVKWGFSVMETRRVSRQGQQFISQQGGREAGYDKRIVRLLISLQFSAEMWFVCHF